MKAFTKFLIVSAALAASLPVINAADPAPAAPADQTAAGKPRPLRNLQQRRALQQQIAKKLHLTTEQRAQFKASRTKTAEALKAIRADTSLSADQKKAKARETLQAARSEMRSVLTPDQLKKWDKLQKHLRQRRGKA